MPYRKPKVTPLRPRGSRKTSKTATGPKVILRKKDAPSTDEKGRVAAGSWVEVERVILKAFERAPTVPEDTKTKPYVLRVSGFLAYPAKVGDPVTVTTLTGRRQDGKLVRVNPSYTHSFGTTVQELLTIGIEPAEARHE